MKIFSHNYISLFKIPKHLYQNAAKKIFEHAVKSTAPLLTHIQEVSQGIMTVKTFDVGDQMGQIFGEKLDYFFKWLTHKYHLGR